VIRSFVFSKGNLIAQDVVLDALKVMLYDADVHIWIDAEAPTDAETKSLLSDVFNFHPLAVEDCVNISERPKIDDYETYVFLVVHGLDYAASEFHTLELNMFIGKNFLLTYHKEPLRSVTTTIERVNRQAPAMAKAPDRLSYAILNELHGNYDPAIEAMSAEIIAIEQAALAKPDRNFLDRVVHLKSQVMRFRQIITPQREVIARLAHGEFKVVRSAMLPYYRDLLDQIARMADHADSYRDTLTATLQVQLNLQQMEVNRVIKVLTVLATLCMPGLIVTSFYGMNVGHLPNTSWSWQASYAAIAVITAIATCGVYLLLKRRKWM
jgi:magnesium transporter